MKQKNMSPRHQQLLQCFTYLPQQILSVHGIDNVSELVLHTLCGEDCFNFPKAAYFVDNPDFDCLKGIAGFDRENEFAHTQCMWKEVNNFSNHTQHCSFNQKVRTIQKPSCKKKCRNDQEVAQELAAELDIRNPSFYAWDTKYDNHSIVVFEHDTNDEIHTDQNLLPGLCLLAFGPVF